MKLIFSEYCRQSFESSDEEFNKIKEKIIVAFESNEPMEVIDSFEMPENFDVD